MERLINQKHLIWVSGAINSGKTTVCKLLNERLIHSVNIELDSLSAFNCKLPIDQKTFYIIQDALDIAANWLKRKYLPILNWPIYGPELVFMMDYAKQLGIKPVMINLTPTLAVVKQNRGSRELTDWELSRIDHLFTNCQINQTTFGYDIDNGTLTPDETAELVISYLNESY